MMTVAKEHGGHTIAIDDDFMRFRVTGPLIERWFQSYSEAEAAIDNANKKYEASERKRISVGVLTSRGDRKTITGIHAGNGSILGLSDGHENFFPDVPWVADAIAKRLRLEKEISTLTAQLRPFQMSSYSIRGHDNLPHGEKVDVLANMIEKTTREAVAVAAIPNSTSEERE